MKNKNLYWIWGAMIQRCTNPNSKQFHDYGGRGITVCKEWREFENFANDMGYKGIGYTLERLDNNLGYNKQNCKWVTRLVNAKNKRVYKSNAFGISGVSPRSVGFRVRLRHKSKIVIDKTVNDFFEACCIRKATELLYVVPYKE